MSTKNAGKAVGSMRWLRNFLGLNPKIPGNDSSLAGFLFVLATGLSLMAAGFFESRGTGQTVAQLFAVSIVLGHLIVQIAYNVHNVVYHPLKRQLESRGEQGVRRWGEWAGALFILSCPVGALLYSFQFFQLFSQSFVWVAEIAIGSLLASSIIKIVKNGESGRVRYNKIFLFLCIATTLIVFVLFWQEGFGGRSVPAEVVLMYGTLLAAYAAHNGVLLLLCPRCIQRSPGHLAAYAVAIFYFIVVVLYLAGVMSVFPLLLSPFMIFTAIVLWLSVDLRFILSRRVKPQKNGNGAAS